MDDELIKIDESKLTKQQIWERKLLDFSLRNNLLNLRLGSKAIPIAAEDVCQLENELSNGADFEIASSLSEQELLATEKRLYRESRTALEENGANTLFLAVGLLHWYEDAKAEKERLAPLLLIPVTMVRKNSTKYVIRLLDEDITFNRTLTELLSQQFNIKIPELAELPEDEQGIDVRKVFDIFAGKIKDQANWKVEEAAVLSLFSFSKFVMWNDIHNNGEKMMKNPIINSIVTKQLSQEVVTQAADMREKDLNDAPSKYALPVDVDSSQLEGVIESGEGRSFILYGPPGTGKSQTITNIIANALFNNKRVLFVAEKMAALQVVQNRLRKIGLDPFCLEMHSNKMTKGHLLEQLQQALDLTHIKSPEEYRLLSDQLFAERKQLNGYMDALHRKGASGLSLYDCIVRFEALKDGEIVPSENYLNSVNDNGLKKNVEVICQLQSVFSVTGHPSAHPLRGLTTTDASLNVQQTLSGKIDSLRQLLPSVIALFNRLNASAVNKVPVSLQSMDWLNTLAAQQKAITAQYAESILSLDATELRNEWTTACNKWFIPRFFAKRSVVNKMKSYRADFNSDGMEALLKLLEERSATLKTYGIQPGQSALTAADIQAIGSLNGLAAKELFDNPDLNDISAHLDQWQKALPQVREWTQWCLRKEELRKAQLENVIQYIYDNPETDAMSVGNALEKGVYRQLAVQAIDASPQLQLFNGVIFEETIAKYRDLAKQFQTITKKELYCRLAANVPSMAIEATKSSEMGLLKRYIASKGRGVSIRKIIEQLPTLLPRLCPCQLMSPMSVAQYVDLNNEPFDLVIFDEASQMPTSEAVGAIARGKALICVGDPKQMPPTSFFQMQSTNDDEAEIDDMESILDDCITLSLPAHYLSWHYRSRHESLIAFSNAQYYEGRLFTFPSVDDRLSKVNFVSVDGFYDFGKTRCNQAEAEAIVEETVRRLKEYAANSEGATYRSIGIVSFSKVQQNLIEDLLTDRLAKEPELEKYAYDVEEPIFVKNLENVQGDERDIILFSIGYGPDKDGKVSMNFGPLNNNGGERRLNVAVSRARYEMMVFSTLQPEMIDLSRSDANGVVGLKKFLEFAKSGRMAVAPSAVDVENGQSAIVVGLSEELRKSGYEVDAQVGRSHFKVDLAVINPKDKNKYLLGILCDGPSYFATKTQRDREITQPGVLKGLGWNLLRVWAVDWFVNREQTIQKVLDELKRLEDADNTDASVKSAQPSVPKTEKPQQPAGFATMPFSVSEDEIVHAETKEIPYQEADIRRAFKGMNAEKLEANSEKLSEDIRKIVEAEQPVNASWIAKRIIKTWGMARTSQRLMDMIANDIIRFKVDRTYNEADPTVWLNTDSTKNFDGFRQANGREIDEIPGAEVSNCIVFAIEQQVSIPREELKKQVSKLMGFNRMGAKVDTVIDNCLTVLLSQGKVTESEGVLKVVVQ